MSFEQEGIFPSGNIPYSLIRELIPFAKNSKRRAKLDKKKISSEELLPSLSHPQRRNLLLTTHIKFMLTAKRISQQLEVSISRFKDKRMTCLKYTIEKDLNNDGDLIFNRK